MKKKPLMISLEEPTIKALSKMGDRNGSMSANQIIAAAACELAKVKPERLWHALGRIAEGEQGELMPMPQPSLPAPRRVIRTAVSAAAGS